MESSNAYFLISMKFQLAVTFHFRGGVRNMVITFHFLATLNFIYGPLAWMKEVTMIQSVF